MRNAIITLDFADKFATDWEGETNVTIGVGKLGVGRR